MEQPSTNAIPPKDSSESSSDTSRDEKEAIIFGGLIFLLVCISWYFGAQTIVTAVVLGALGCLTLLGYSRLARACGYMKEYREAIDIHSHQLNILLDERSRSRVGREEEWRRPQ